MLLLIIMNCIKKVLLNLNLKIERWKIVSIVYYDEINPDLLTAVNIDLSDNLTDENNSLVLCDTHARKYFEKEFVFLKSGKIKINRKSGTLDERMHLARNLVILKKKYLFEK